MNRFLALTVFAATLTFAPAAQAHCDGSATTAGVSDVFRATVDGHELGVRTIGSPFTIGMPPVTAAAVCDDGSVEPVRAMHVSITNPDGDVLCDQWTSDIGSYDPFGFGLLLGAGIAQPKNAAHPCGVSGTWDPVGYAGTIPAGGDPTRLRFPAVEEDDFGSSAGIGVGSIFTGEIWWTTEVDGEPVVVVLEGNDATSAYYVRGVGTANYSG